ncbi:MAG TPA: FHA domain-containing protein [Gemmatimonadaceae bacterium]|nr:FHA domain-containing protein [Gemmatimonadaceae bacterium]
MLRPGRNTLGGRGADALPIAGLAFQPAVATITLPESGPAIIQRVTAAVVVRLNDVPLGVAPAELRNGATIDVAGIRLVYDAFGGSADHAAASRSGEHAASVSGETGTAAPAPIAHLVNVKSGERFALTGHRVSIGRDLECDVVLPDNGVSRRHATIAPVPGGYLLTDESSNGTLVNGERMGATHLLEPGDVLRMHDEEIRYEVEEAEATTPAAASRAPTTILDMSSLRSVLAAEQTRSSSRRHPTASLEIIRGPFAGASFQIERPVASIGRGEQSDVRLRDESVSSAHATLLRKGDTWYVVDLRSVNGTFVDGYGVAGERELHTGATLRVGAVEMLFRSYVGGVEEAHSRRKTGLWAWFKRLFREPPPHRGSVL